MDSFLHQCKQHKWKNTQSKIDTCLEVGTTLPRWNINENVTNFQQNNNFQQQKFLKNICAEMRHLCILFV